MMQNHSLFCLSKILRGGMSVESILISVKKVLGGISEEDESFDVDIIMHINSAFAILNQLGVGPEEGYTISDSTQTWNEFLGNDKRLEFVKTFVQQKVKLIFDPPQSSAHLESIKQTISELEFRILSETDKPKKDDTNE